MSALRRGVHDLPMIEKLGLMTVVPNAGSLLAGELRAAA